jgi:CheY-like chemotaxis protein
VKVLLPEAVTKPSEAAAPAREGEALKLAGRTVLLVDDDEQVRSSVADQLDRLGCLTFTAADGDAAEAMAREVLASLGVDADGFEYEVMSDTGIAQLVQVTAYQVVDDQRTGLAWSVSLVGDGVQSLWGSLAPLVDLGAYDVVSPRAAVERLTDPRFGSTGGGMMPFAAADMARSAESGIAVDPAAEPTVPPTATAGPIAWPVEDVTITSARLGLAFTSLPDGAAVLLPTYELSSDDGRTWTVVAVADDELDFSVPR